MFGVFEGCWPITGSITAADHITKISQAHT